LNESGNPESNNDFQYLTRDHLSFTGPTTYMQLKNVLVAPCNQLRTNMSMAQYYDRGFVWGTRKQKCFENINEIFKEPRNRYGVSPG